MYIVGSDKFAIAVHDDKLNKTGGPIVRIQRILLYTVSAALWIHSRCNKNTFRVERKAGVEVTAASTRGRTHKVGDLDPHYSRCMKHEHIFNPMSHHAYPAF